MAKVKFSALVSEMRGKLNGSVFTKNRSGIALRNKITPVNRRTSAQANIKSLFTSYNQKWRTLTDDQRNAWNNATEDFKRTNIFGDSFKLTGMNLYTELNVNLALVGGTEITTPPVPDAISGISSLSTTIDATVGSESFTITYLPTPTDADVVHMIYATRCYSPGKSYVQNEYRLIGTIPAASDSPYNALSEWQSKFGTLTKDQMISVRLVPVSKTRGIKSKASNDYATKVQ